MKLTRVLATTATAAAAAALVVLPAPAHADSFSQVDATADVRSLDATDPSFPDVAAVAAPTRAVGDISRLRLAHTRSSVRVTLRFRELNRTGFLQEHQFQFVSAQRQRVVLIDANRKNWAGKATMVTLRNKKVACSLKHRIDYAANTVVLQVPRTCLGSPARVKVGAGTAIGYGTKLYFDDAQRPGGEFSDAFAFSPLVRRAR